MYSTIIEDNRVIIKGSKIERRVKHITPNSKGMRHPMITTANPKDYIGKHLTWSEAIILFPDKWLAFSNYSKKRFIYNQ